MRTGSLCRVWLGEGHGLLQRAEGTLGCQGASLGLVLAGSGAWWEVVGFWTCGWSGN